ncbi:unnamed protein product [Allacma fusca]|uniref:Decaprenyl-diphosphate synthase subunit 2 n=1 Tax=Allacma fusca TaxID=39272 RepID=A0A8J2KLN0_9HEXA|nr:unnamed protein product [Allacma fusca]
MFSSIASCELRSGLDRGNKIKTMWKRLWITALRNVREDSAFKGRFSEKRFLRRCPQGVNARPCCSNYSTSIPCRQAPFEKVGVNLVGTEIVPLEKSIRDAKELLELDSFPSLASLTLKSLFSNQVDVIRTHMVKLVGSDHPIVRLAQDFYQENVSLFQQANSTLDNFDEKSVKGAVHSSISTQLRAVLVLLVSKSIGFPSASVARSTEAEVAKTILNKQRAIAEITEMMHTAYTLHETIVNIPSHEETNVPPVFREPVAVSRLHDGNNLAALMGDFLLGKTSDELWFRKSRLGTGSLIRNACQSCLIFSGHEEAIINLGRHLGEQLGLLLQASKEIEFFTAYNKTEEIPVQFDLCTLPVIHAVQCKYISTERLTALAENYDYDQIYKEVVKCRSSIDDAISKVICIQQNIEKMLNQLNSSSPEAVSILIKLIRCVASSTAGQGHDAIKRDH